MQAALGGPVRGQTPLGGRILAADLSSSAVSRGGDYVDHRPWSESVAASFFDRPGTPFWSRRDFRFMLLTGTALK